MCGIVGIVSDKNVSHRLVDGLKRLEYRGYDSAGIATLAANDHIERRRAEGKLINLENKLNAEPLAGNIGIGHTRWATHGGPTERNAHPHATDRVAVVHNGIIENYQELRSELETLGAKFQSDTDTEVIAHLMTHYLDLGDTPQEATKKSLIRLQGAFAIAMVFANDNNLMIGARRGTPLALGYGKGEMFLASDSYALAPMTDTISYLEDGDWLVVNRDKVEIYDEHNNPVQRQIRQSVQSSALTGKGEYRHFMLKEIFEQPAVLADTLNSFLHPVTGKVTMQDKVLELADASRLTISACGTAYYAGLTAKYWFEGIARLPVETDVASEFRYREAPLPKDGAALFISQSGETLDTLEAMRYCKKNNQRTMAVVNAIESTIERETGIALHTLAGPEIGVASTKAFTTQLTTLACMALAFGVKRGHVDAATEQKLSDALRHIPSFAADILKQDDHIKKISKAIMHVSDVLYIGRGTSYPIALEGALKLKEISYIHAEGFASGELKHGSIALIDENVPVVVIAPRDHWFEKTASNLKEVHARGGKVLLISDKQGCEQLKDDCEWTIEMPDCDPFISAILYTLPIQLLAYHVAVLKGTDVDQPRNLAKSVTVE
jgi:glucosamine--fructose-6-phosphate aminotransferase (isomerizing)